MPTTSNITIKDILCSSHFKNAKLVAGATGVNRIVSWVHILEVNRYVQESVNGGELILTTGIGFVTHETAISFLKHLIERNVAGLCIDINTYQTNISEEMIELANKHGLPLIILTELSRFIDITQDLLTMIITNTSNKLLSIDFFEKQLNSILISSHNIIDVLYLIHHYLDINVAYVPQKEEPIIVSDLPSDKQEKIINILLTQDKENITNSWTYRTIFTLNNQQWGHLYIFHNNDKIIRKQEKIILDRCATAISHIIQRELLIKEQKKNEQNIWIKQWLSGNLHEKETLKHLKANGLSFQPTGFTVCLLQVNSNNNKDNNGETSNFDIAYIARSFFEQEGYYALSYSDASEIVFILLDKKDRNTWQQGLQKVINKIKELKYIKDLQSKKIDLLFGVGKRVDNINLLNKSYVTAQETITIQEKSHLDNPIYDSLGVYRIISLINKKEDLNQITFDHISPIIEHDKKNVSDLLHTLKIYLGCNCSKQETAKQLFIARQTLYYRLHKIEELLGSDYILPDNRLAIEFAIRAYQYFK